MSVDCTVEFDVPGPVIETDEAGTVTAWNRAAEELFGWNESEAVGKRLSDLFVPASEAFILESRFEYVLLAGDWQAEMLFMTKEGNLFAARIDVRRVEEGGVGFRLEFPDSPPDA